MSFTERLRLDRETVFEEIYEKAFPQVARLVQRHGGHLAEAKDVFHDALIILYEKSQTGQLKMESDPEAYAIGIARNLCYRQHRKAQRLIDLDQVDPGQLTEETPSPPPAHQRLLKFLESAGRRCMDLLQAFYYQRLNMREIAEEFGYSTERSATVQKYKCLEKVRSQVKPESYEEITA